MYLFFALHTHNDLILGSIKAAREGRRSEDGDSIAEASVHGDIEQSCPEMSLVGAVLSLAVVTVFIAVASELLTGNRRVHTSVEMKPQIHSG